MRTMTVLMLAGLATGCVTEQTYLSQAQAEGCKRYEECDKSSFEAQYDNQAECREDNDDFVQDLTDCAVEACDSFDAKEAAEALADIRTASCTEYDSAFADAATAGFSDCNGLELAACLAGF